MFSVLKKVFLISIVTMLLLVATLAMNTVSEVHKANREMSSIVRDAHGYSVMQTQDIDIIKKQINSSEVSKDAYRMWLNAMRNYNGLQNLHSNGSTVSGSTIYTSESDDALTDSIIPFLEDDFSSNNYGYTPLNFGITYLDPQLLENDMEFYIKRMITECADTLRWGRSGMHKIDPNTIKVEAFLDMVPFRIDNLFYDATKQRAFIQMFGLEIPDSLSAANSKYLTKGQIKTVVRYNVRYKITWDYIPNLPLLGVNRKQTAKWSTSNTPPAGLYFPFWYNKMGNINPPNLKLNNAQRKMLLEKPQEFNYEYVLTH